ncbi:hypothetical protein HPY09_20640 (plasmid) [Vibrio cholerae]|nr:hypothetical protein [Vibrio cholerae]MBJ6953163.1 hypothetical protein [Vibrio cholerae]MVC22340.1 hypothetical protein [Vibrio cholerae]QKU73435.1 hypothetical protein HPY09_20640 [Vibrio cholerae]QKU77391.1 hypothetical protein HPY05_20835 [Vibrio cholerae]
MAKKVESKNNFIYCQSALVIYQMNFLCFL